MPKKIIYAEDAIEALTEIESHFVFEDGHGHLLRWAKNTITALPSAQTEIIRCKECKWWDKYSEKRGYCMAAKHGFMSSHWEISIYRIYDEDFFCADAERRPDE